MNQDKEANYLGAVQSLRKQLEEKNSRIVELEATIKEIFGDYSPFTTIDLLQQFVDTTKILLNHCDYDGHGWEVILHASEEAEQRIKVLNRIKMKQASERAHEQISRVMEQLRSKVPAGQTRILLEDVVEVMSESATLLDFISRWIAEYNHNGEPEVAKNITVKICPANQMLDPVTKGTK